MSPIVYVPPKKHECRPPMQGMRYLCVYGGLYPEGTIWECDDCGARWELSYGCCYTERIYGSASDSSIVKVIWNRLDD